MTMICHSNGGAGMNNKINQHFLIAEYIRNNGSITGWEAHEHIGVESFPKRISEMIKKGYPLDFKWEKDFNRYGRPVRFKRWFFTDAKARGAAI